MSIRITQGQFSFLPELSDEQITRQLKYAIDNDWAVNVEYTDDPHPRNTYWEMWGLPMFDVADPAGILLEINACREAFPDRYIRVSAFDDSPGVESLRLSFIVNRPEQEPGFRLEREDAAGRSMRYKLHAYATDRPAGRRYGP